MVKVRNFLLLAGAGLCCTGTAYMIKLACEHVCDSLCNAMVRIVDSVYGSEK